MSISINDRDQFYCHGGNFQHDRRGMELELRLHQYYRDTPEEMSNDEAKKYEADFKEWCQIRNYTQEEILHARRRVKSE